MPLSQATPATFSGNAMPVMASDPVQVPATAIRDQPRDTQEGATIGINVFREPAWERLDRMPTQPFIGSARSYSINAREVDRGPSGEFPAKDTRNKILR